MWPPAAGSEAMPQGKRKNLAIAVLAATKMWRKADLPAGVGEMRKRRFTWNYPLPCFDRPQHPREIAGKIHDVGDRRHRAGHQGLPRLAAVMGRRRGLGGARRRRRSPA